MHVRVSRQVINRQGFSLMETKDRPGAFSSAQSQLSIRLDSPLTAWIASGRLKQVWSTPDLSRYRRPVLKMSGSTACPSSPPFLPVESVATEPKRQPGPPNSPSKPQ